MEFKRYFPCLTIREAESRAVENLASPTKDLIFPIAKLQAWPRKKEGEGTPIERSLKAFEDAYSGRPFALDLSKPRTDLDTDWAIQGRNELSQLLDPSNGHEQWCRLFLDRQHLIPTIQWTGDSNEILGQVQRLEQLGRGLVLRLRRTENWNFDKITALTTHNFKSNNLLVIFDCEQIEPREDLTVIGTSVQNALLSVNSILSGGNRTYVLAGSSFPSSFADIHPEYANLPLRERQLFDLLKLSPPLLQAGISLEYGDHASVYAADRPPAFRGAPRVDYPTATSWIYHRTRDGFDVAAKKVRNDPLWDDSLLCWGAQRIRTAVGGNMTGLNSQGPWVSIRLNIHLHRQAHMGSDATTPIEEDWED